VNKFSNIVAIQFVFSQQDVKTSCR